MDAIRLVFGGSFLDAKHTSQNLRKKQPTTIEFKGSNSNCKNRIEQFKKKPVNPQALWSYAFCHLGAD